MSNNEETIEELESKLSSNPDDVSLIAKLASKITESGNFKKSENLLREAQKKFPENGEIDYAFGYIYRVQNNQRKTLECLLEAEKKGFTNHKMYYNTGLTFRLLEDFENSVIYYDKSLQEKPDFAPALFEKGMVYQMLEHLDLSVELITKAIEINPKNGSYYGGRALARNRMGDFDNYLDDINKAWEFKEDLKQEQIRTIPLMVIFVALQGKKIPVDIFKLWISRAIELTGGFSYNQMEKMMLEKGKSLLKDLEEFGEAAYDMIDVEDRIPRRF